MALFGSLGKMLGLDTPFGQGLVTGLAEGVTREVKDDMKSRKERINRLADNKIKRDEEERERYTKELRENLEKVKGIAGKAGGINGAEWLIRTYGIEEAVNKAGQFEIMKGYGKNPEFLLDDENTTTFEDLARFVTADPTFTKLTARGTRADTGLLAKIGLAPDFAVEAQKQRDAAASRLGLGVTEKTDLGVMPTSKGFDPSDFGMMADIKDESNRMVMMALSAKDAGDDALYEDYMGRAATMRNSLLYLDAKGPTESGVRAFSNNITGFIAEAANIETKYIRYSDGSTSNRTAWQRGQDRTNAKLAADKLTEAYGNALRRGVVPEVASRVAFEAAQKNRQMVFVEGPDGKPGVAVGDAPLVANGFKGADGTAYQIPIQGPPPPQQPATGTQSTTQSVTQSATTSAATPNVIPGVRQITPAIQALIDEHNATADPDKKKDIQTKIGRAMGGSIPSNVDKELR